MINRAVPTGSGASAGEGSGPRGLSQKARVRPRPGQGHGGGGERDTHSPAQHAHTCTSTHAHTHIHMGLCACTRACMRVHMHNGTCTNIQACTHAHTAHTSKVGTRRSGGGTFDVFSHCGKTETILPQNPSFYNKGLSGARGSECRSEFIIIVTYQSIMVNLMHSHMEGNYSRK